MTWLMNRERPLAVTAVTQQIKPNIYPKVDDEATVVLTYPKVKPSFRLPGIGRLTGKIWKFMDVPDMQSRYGEMNSPAKPGEKEEHTISAKEIAAPENDSLHYLAAVVRKQIQPSGSRRSKPT